MTQNAVDGLLTMAAVFGAGVGLIAYGLASNAYVGAGAALVGFAVFPMAALVTRRWMKP